MNPIVWALTLRPAASSALSAFGAGFFEDAGDVPGEPVLMYTLRGEWEPPGEGTAAGAAAGDDAVDAGAVRLTKEYTSPSLFGVGPTVRYEGRLVRGSVLARRCAAVRATRRLTRRRNAARATARAVAAGGRRLGADRHVAKRGGGHARRLRCTARG